MEFEFVKQLASYGLLGVVSALFGAWALSKDRQLTKERLQYMEKLEAQAAAHKAEMHALEERYITKAETWMTKHHELMASMNDVMDRLEKRLG